MSGSISSLQVDLWEELQCLLKSLLNPFRMSCPSPIYSCSGWTRLLLIGQRMSLTLGICDWFLHLIGTTTSFGQVASPYWSWMPSHCDMWHEFGLQGEMDLFICKVQINHSAQNEHGFNSNFKFPNDEQLDLEETRFVVLRPIQKSVLNTFGINMNQSLKLEHSNDERLDSGETRLLEHSNDERLDYEENRLLVLGYIQKSMLETFRIDGNQILKLDPKSGSNGCGCIFIYALTFLNREIDVQDPIWLLDRENLSPLFSSPFCGSTRETFGVLSFHFRRESTQREHGEKNTWCRPSNNNELDYG
ncbi:hypothetical protein H5410_052555 [Solanum commersonii]|uniref:Uncharacterized protein n=1 Tax=Solanum commersonii TaxID=4109 RepID=A0A9J5X4F6_SOLCO|nr:hypothetical protein H5410_052555 [Solanum commersonii]